MDSTIADTHMDTNRPLTQRAMAHRRFVEALTSEGKIKQPDLRRMASRYDGAYGLAGHPEAGVLPGDYRVPGTSMTPHQWEQELRRRLRDGLDLAGAPLYRYRIVDTRDGSLIASRPTLRAANRRRPRKCFYRVEHDQE